jgi:hypothetical protein
VAYHKKKASWRNHKAGIARSRYKPHAAEIFQERCAKSRIEGPMGVSIPKMAGAWQP